MKFILEIWTKCFMDERLYNSGGVAFSRFKDDYEALVEHLKFASKPDLINRGVCIDGRGFAEFAVFDPCGVRILTCDLRDVDFKESCSRDFTESDESCFAIDSRVWRGKVFCKSFLGSFDFNKLKLLLTQTSSGRLVTKVIYDSREYLFDSFARFGELSCAEIYLEKFYPKACDIET